MLLGALGCSSIRVMRTPVRMAVGNQARRLVDCHRLHPTTQAYLAETGLADVERDEGLSLLALLERDLAADPSPGRLLALAELAYQEARRDDGCHPDAAWPWYRDAAVWAYFVLASPAAPAQHARACGIHNLALERIIQIQRPGWLERDESMIAQIERWGFTPATQSPYLDPRRYTGFTPCREYSGRGMQDWYQKDGLGVPVLAVRPNDPRHPREPVDRFFPRHLNVAITTLVRPTGPPAQWRQAPVELCLYDPFEAARVTVGAMSYELANDRTTPLAKDVELAPVTRLGLSGLFRPLRAEPLVGVYMNRPYQPGRIPVVFIHGLDSSPWTWVQTLNHLQSDRALASRYQFWFYLYTTGAAIPDSAKHLREDLREAIAILDPGGKDPALREMILVGHSMGGLVARITGQDSGNEVWDAVFRKPPNELVLKPETRKELVEDLFYEPEPYVSRMIFIAAPHKGSYQAGSPIGRLVGRFIRRPGHMNAAVTDARRDNGRQILAPGIRPRMLDGVGGLRPRDPVLQAIDSIPVIPTIPCHSIILHAKVLGLMLPWDGLVSTRSARYEPAVSETHLPGFHTDHTKERVTCEIKRILWQAWRERGGAPPSSRTPGCAASPGGPSPR